MQNEIGRPEKRQYAPGRLDFCFQVLCFHQNKTLSLFFCLDMVQEEVNGLPMRSDVQRNDSMPPVIACLDRLAKNSNKSKTTQILNKNNSNTKTSK